MFLIRTTFIITIFIYASQALAQDSTNKYTLQQCVEIAAKNNLDVNNAQFQKQTSEVNLQQQKGNMLPFISGNIGHNNYNGRSINTFTNTYTNQQYLAANYGLNASVVLWNGSSIQNYIKQYALNAKAAEMDVQQQKDKLLLNIVLYYLTVLSNEEQLKLAQKQVTATQQKVKLLEIKNNDGAISPSDLYDLKGQLAADQLTVIATKNALESAKLNLAQLMNIPYSTNMQLQQIDENILPEPYTATVAEIYDHAAASLALVKATDLRKQSTSKAIVAAKGAMLPTLSLSGGLYTNYSSTASTSQLLNTNDIASNNYVLVNSIKTPVYIPQSNYQSEKISYGSQWKNNFNSAIGINLSIPILNGLQARSRVKQAQINKAQADFLATTTRTQLRQAIEQDFVNMTASYETYKTLFEQVQAYTQSFRAAEIRFDAGAIVTLDYLIVKNNIEKANISLTAAKYDYIFRTKILDFYLGRPLW
jgi:outer membrane protein